MPRSTRSKAVTAQHAATQAAIDAGVKRQVLALWGVVDPSNVDAAWPAVSRALARTVTDGHAASTQAAAEYLREHAQAAGVSLADVVTAPQLDAERLETALRVTGPVAVKRAAASGRAPAEAVKVAAVQLAGATSRLVQAGGRDTIAGTVAASSQIAGYRRTTSGHGCWFCSMLASRGAVYKTEHSAGTNARSRRNPLSGGFVGEGAHKFHDHCHCGIEVLYEHEPEPDDVRALQDQWERVTAGATDKAAAWRTWHEARAASTILSRDLTQLADDALAELLGEATLDDEVDKVVAELDRRDEVTRAEQRAEAEKAKRAAAREAKRRADAEALDAEFDRRLDAGDDPESAYADVYGVSVERQRRDQAISSLRANGYTGRNFDELTRAAFRDYVHQSWLDAEAATRGALFRGKTRAHEQREVIALFNGSEAYARANASEELLGYWQEHGRLSLDDYRASLLGGQFKMKGQAAWL